jgi:glycosyltransferase involved in cell wall biosynthesis
MGCLEVDIVIPTYNACHSIVNLLQDLQATKQKQWFAMRNIYVILDASTDQTDNVVRAFSQDDERVNLIRKPERRGKSDSINMAISLTNSDVLITLDSDIRLANRDVIEHMLRPIRDDQAALVGANIIPRNPGIILNPARLARHFDWILEEEIRRRKPHSYWSAYGRALAMSRNLYQELVLPRSQADDLYIYFSCLRNGHRFAYAEEAVFYFEASTSVGEYLRQWSRFDYYTQKARKEFGEDLVNAGMEVEGMRNHLLCSTIRYPYYTLMWVVCRLGRKVMHLTASDYEMLDRGLY